MKTRKYWVLAQTLVILLCMAAVAWGVSTTARGRSLEDPLGISDTPSMTEADSAATDLGAPAPRSASATKDRQAPKKDRTQPPSEQPVASDEPSAPPQEPAVVPDEPTAPVDVPGTVTGVGCVSGDMQDVISFAAPQSGGPVSSYVLYAAPGPEAQYVRTATAASDATTFTISVETTGTTCYRISAVGPGGEGTPSAPVTNAHVSMTRVVDAAGATLHASNGEVVLELPAGAFETSTTVCVEEVSGSPTGGIVSLAGVYEITPSGPLGAPARLSVAYTLAVTHTQVSETLLRAAGLMTYDEAAGTWVTGGTGVTAEGGYLSGTLSHFSYWTGGTIQPHGTAGTTVDYCTGVCHDLATYPGSTIRYDSRDPQICYNCHGSADLVAAPAGAPGENVQASIEGAGISSSHPVVLGGLYCTTCHDPHANPATAPGLLKSWDPTTGKYVTSGGGIAPDTSFCWTCHGSVNNRRTDYLHNGYYADSGGDKKTAFNGAHTALGAASWRYDTQSQLSRGSTSSTSVSAGGSVGLAGTVVLPKAGATVTSDSPAGYGGDSPVAPIYDGKSSPYLGWYARFIGAAAANTGNPVTGTFGITIDLGATKQLRSFDFLMYNTTGFDVGTWSMDRVEIQTSDDNLNWQTIGSLGTVGTRLGDRITIDASGAGRYVRFVCSRAFENPYESITFTEIDVYSQPTQGTFEVWPDIARNASYSGGTLKWSATVPPTGSLSVDVRASTDKGVTWTAWQPVTNGGSLTQIPLGASLLNARLQVRTTMSTSGASPTLDWLEVTLRRGTIPGAVPQWSGATPANLCRRCHTSHGSPSAGLVDAVTSTASCKTCHSAAYGSSYTGAVPFQSSKHASVPCADCHTAHGKSNNSGTTYAFLLKNERAEACLDCHTSNASGVPDVKTGLDAKSGTAAEWAKHDIFSSEQVKTGSSLTCRNCHGTHFSSTGLVNPDSTSAAFTTMRDDPASVPTGEVVIYASKDTLIDSAAGQQTWNYGATTQFTITQTARALLYFDLSAIPPGATIQNATLYLWKTDPGTITGNYRVYPASRSWLEGTGNGVVNSAGVNGATWLERQWGDNANTGNVAGGDWAVPGGDYVVTPTALSSGMWALNMTSVAQALLTGPNYGIVLTDGGSATSVPIYTREHPTEQYRPNLRIVYRTGPATRQVVDDIAFCNKCHDGTLPGAKNLANAYSLGVHGGAKGLGPGSDRFGYWAADQGGGGLKAPYYYGMDALPCSTCHDPHGSRLPYHLREVINATPTVSLPVGTPLYGYDWGYGTATEGSGLGYFCSACHIIPASHMGYTDSISNCSSG